MDAVLLLARLLLAAVFAGSGLAKLVDRTGSRQALVDFGVPTRLARPVGVALPLIELAVALALIPAGTARAGAAGAAALLLLFVAGIGYNLARGRRPDCRCFGQLHSEPVGPATLVRNGVLLAVAGLVLVRGRDVPSPSVLAWLAGLSPSLVAALVGGGLLVGLLGGVAWLLVHLLVQNGRLLLRVEALEARLNASSPPAERQAREDRQLPVGAAAPAFVLPTLDGKTLSLDALRAGGAPGASVVLLFTDPNCAPCTRLLPDVARWERDLADRLTTALISRGTRQDNRAKATEHGLTAVLLQRDFEVAEAYGVSATPSAVLVRPDGTVGSSVAEGAAAIRSLVARVAEAPAAAVGDAASNGRALAPAQEAPTPLGTARTGQPAPPFALPDLKGKTVDLAAFRGSQALVLFWDPNCGYCRRMLDDLKAWEAAPPSGAPQLLVVSEGTVEENQTMGLRSPVVLDQTFGTARAFGATGTPSAVLVDARGRIASEVAEGASAVLALAKAGRRERPPVPSAG